MTDDLTTSLADGPSLFRRFRLLRIARNQLESEMREILTIINRDFGESYPYYHCKHCGYDWRGRIIARRPRGCPRCHSTAWDDEPVLRTARRPTDPPNEKWRERKRLLPAPKHPLPPPPPITNPDNDISPPPVYVPPASVRFGEEVSDVSHDDEGGSGK